MREKHGGTQRDRLGSLSISAMQCKMLSTVRRSWLRVDVGGFGKKEMVYLKENFEKTDFY